MKNETFYYSKDLILEIIRTYKMDFIEDLDEAYNRYFINPANPEDIQYTLHKYIFCKNRFPSKNLTEEEEYDLDFQKEKYREFKRFHGPKKKVIKN